MSGADVDGTIALVQQVPSGGYLDATDVTFIADPVTRKRERVVIGGDQAAELADVLNAAPATDSYGLVVRPIQSQFSGGRDLTKRRGSFLLASTEATLNSAADAATGGKFWLVNTSSTVLVRLVEAHFTCVLTNLIDLAAATPDLTMERMTFTGTPSGAQITPAKRDSADDDNVGTFRTASTGMSITAGAKFASWIPVTLSVIGGLLAANTAAVAATEQIFSPRDESGDIILRQNEGVVWRQNSAGTANESRVVQVDIIWEEFDL